MAQAEYLLAVDVSLDRLDAALEGPDGKYLFHHRAFPNNWPGYQQLRDELASLAADPAAQLTVAAESTGNYWWHLFYHISQDPVLTPLHPTLALLNPAHVKHFRKALPEQDKEDELDPKLIGTFYRSTKVKPAYTFTERYLPLRQWTRAYCRLIHTLAAEKAFFLHLVYLWASEYPRLKPFSDPLGVASQHFLLAQPDLSPLAELPVETLADLVRWASGNHCPDPAKNAGKLERVFQDSYPLAESLQPTVQALLQLTYEHIRFLTEQKKGYQQHLLAELDQLPEAQEALAEKGLGPVLVGGCLAEIQDTTRFLQGLKYDRKKKRERPRNYQDGQAAVGKLAGLWWPGRSSGRFAGQDNHLARERNTYLRFWLVQAAVSLKGHQADYCAYYWRKRKEVPHHQHERALLLTARKAARLIFALLYKGQQRWRKEAEVAS